MDVIVVAHEWIESTNLHPASTQLFICVTEETTNVSADHWDAVHLELQNSCTQRRPQTHYIAFAASAHLRLSSGDLRVTNSLNIFQDSPSKTQGPGKLIINSFTVLNS